MGRNGGLAAQDSSSDSVRYHRKHSETGVVRQVSRDKGGSLGRVTKHKEATKKLWKSHGEAMKEYRGKTSQVTSERGKRFWLTVGAFLLTVKLLCLQSLKALIRRTFPLSEKSSNCK